MTSTKFTRKHTLEMAAFVCAGIACLALACLNTGCRVESARQGASPELILTKNGAPAATIVVDREANKAARFAAAELQYHIEKISGAKLPIADDGAEIQGIRILVGESAATRALGLNNKDFKHQEYLIKFLPNTLILMGRDKVDKGAMDYADYKTFPGPDPAKIDRIFFAPTNCDENATCYAAYDFLERYCGVRWYLPTDLGLVCPQAKTLVVKGADIRRAPAMKFRAIFLASSVPADFGDEGGPLLAERERALYLHRQRLVGIEPYAWTHAFYGYLRDKLALKDHLDWFAKGYDQDMPAELRNTPVEKRTIDTTWRGYPNLYYPNMCYTSTGFIQQVVASARSYFDTGKTLGGEPAAGDYFSLEPLDSQDKYCKCPACAALLHEKAPCDAWRKHSAWVGTDIGSDYMFGFANKVAREVAKTHPDKYLTKLAYSRTWYPPTREPLEPNVSVMVVVFSHLRAVPELDLQTIEFLDKWDEATRAGNNPKYLGIHFHRPGRVNPEFPGFTARLMVKQMEDYHRRGYRGIFAEPAYMPDLRELQKKPGFALRCPYVNLLEMYLAYKLAYDETLDGDKLIDEFFTLFYGAAARPMQNLYEAIERVYCDPENYTFDRRYFGYQTPDIAWGRLGTAEHMAEFGKLMAEAKAAAQTEMEKKRVVLFEKNIWNRMQAGRKEYEEREAQKTGAQLKSARAARITVAAPGGDPDKAPWAQTPPSAILGGFGTLEGKPTSRKLEARLLYDDSFLYVQLQEMMDPAKLVIKGDDNIWEEDDWELFVGRERGKGCRQIGVNAKGACKTLAYGETELEWESGVRVVSDTKNPDRWTVRMAFPLEKLLPGGVKPGQTIYLNICRGTGGDVKNALSWNPTFAGFQAPAQMGAVQLVEDLKDD